LQVTYSKLRRYIEEQGGYDLYEVGLKVELSFVPSFPEALEKSAGESTPRVTMKGVVDSDRLTIFSITVEQDGTTREKDPETAELTYKSWLAFIEENY
jgi:hypothetical protein